VIFDLRTMSRIGTYILLAVMVAAGIYFYHDWQESRYQKAITMTQEQMESMAELKKRLHTSEQNAAALQAAIQKINTGQTQPVVNYYVQSPTVQQAAEKVQQQINNKDLTLPATALEQTDRTVVTANVDQQKVDVYKVTLDKRWEIGLGVGYHNEFYLPIEIQKNFGKRGISVELHLQQDGITGGEVKTVFRF